MPREFSSLSDVVARPSWRAACTTASLSVAAALSVSQNTHAQSVADQVGLTSLIQRVGAGNQPTGAGVAIGQVEADGDGVQGPPILAYPNTTVSDFAGKSFFAQSGAMGVSGHATFVGQQMYGSGSIAPDITIIYMYEASSWLQAAYLFAGIQPTTLPAVAPNGVRVFNNSWIGDAAAFNNEILRRADFAIDRDDVIQVNGVNNGIPPTALMTYGYNGLAVGMLSGTHASGNTTGEADGPGRMKPEVVAPGGATSYAAPVVSAAAALMYQTAQSSPLASNPNARKSETIKAVLLAGAMHSGLGTSGTTPWSNNPAASGTTRGVTSTPLDPVFGAGLVNVDRSHRILTGNEQNGSTNLPTMPNISAAGWDFASLNAGGVLSYRFRLQQPVNSVSILTTWHRGVPSDFGTPAVANFDLTLKRIDTTDAAVSLVGDAGLPYFAGGNVVSQSAVDNVEHLYLPDLAAGDYVIELRRLNDGVRNAREVALAWIMPVTFRPGDTNGDGVVNVTDLLAVVSTWGTCVEPDNCPADFNNDDVVNVTDLLTVIGNWG